jgi:PBSX family phage terminase large subunit
MKKKEFNFLPFSPKQRRLMYWWADGSPYKGMDVVIADGAIRSGKTIAMICGFFLWSTHTFRGEAFILAGKTIGALKKNVISPALQILRSWGLPYKYVSSGDEARLEVGQNIYYLYDAHNERSQDRLQGLTAAGALADEVALFPRSFVEQMLGRCSVDGARVWLNCNPENPAHYVKTELIDKAQEKRIYRLHFLMDDNYTLSPKTKERYLRMHSGVFYRRFILGQWARTDGLVYPQFANDSAAYVVDQLPEIQLATIGVDFGGTGSAHSFTLVGFTPGYKQVVILDEYYHKNTSGRVLSPADVEQAFVAFVQRAKARVRVYEARCDSAEQTMIQGLRIAAAKARVGIDVKNAIKGTINERIVFTNSMLAQGRFLVHSSCLQTQKAMCEAVYDSKKATQDVRLDDGSTNIDSLDSMEYAIEPVMHDILYLGLRGR